MLINKLRTQSGSALVTAIILSVLCLALIVMYQKSTLQHGKDAVHRLDSQQSLALAESAISQAMDWLRMPAAGSLLPASGTYTLPMSMVSPAVNSLVNISSGSYSVTLARDPFDGSLVTATATGYFDLSGGSEVDPVTNRRAESAVVQSTLRVQAISDYFASVPTTLQIDFGSDLSSASIYARDLVFVSGSAGQNTKILAASYYNTVMPSAAPSFVSFTSAPAQAQQLSAEPNLIALNDTLRSYYLAWAGSDQLAAGQTLTGILPPPINANGIYYCHGDLTLGNATTALQINSPMIFYVESGSITIQNSVNVGASGWAVLLAEGNVVISHNAPTPLGVNATIVTNGQLVAELPVHLGGQLNFKGGFQAEGGANLGTAWPTRQYQYYRAPSSMVLPFFLSTESYKVIKGKFYHG